MTRSYFRVRAEELADIVSLIDEGMGDTDSQDEDDPLLCASQKLWAIIDRPTNPTLTEEFPALITSIEADILRIMEVHDDQMENNGCVDTPGGLEHMGDVWRLLAHWRDEINGRLTSSEPTP